MRTEELVRRIVSELGGLTMRMDDVSDDDDLFAAGMTSHASVNVMLGVESEFEIEFPDEMLKRSVFESIRAMSVAVDELRAGLEQA